MDLGVILDRYEEKWISTYNVRCRTLRWNVFEVFTTFGVETYGPHFTAKCMTLGNVEDQISKHDDLLSMKEL